jgi:uncharacterized protein YdeI (YjbR/CyaY-like superfamily)
MEPIFFPTPADFRAWLEQNHDTARELFVGFYRKATGKPTMTWSEAVDQALCFGWIDGVRHSLDAESYTNRFTPRRPGSNWSAVNIRKVEELTKAGLMEPAGLAAFARRLEGKSSVYSYEQRYEARLTPEQEQEFRAHPAAWEFFQSQPPSYRQTAIWWVVSAKREETRARRLAALIDDSANGWRVGVLLSPGKKQSP